MSIFKGNGSPISRYVDPIGTPQEDLNEYRNNKPLDWNEFDTTIRRYVDPIETRQNDRNKKPLDWSKFDTTIGTDSSIKENAIEKDNKFETQNENIIKGIKETDQDAEKRGLKKIFESLKKQWDATPSWMKITLSGLVTVGGLTGVSLAIPSAIAVTRIVGTALSVISITDILSKIKGYNKKDGLTSDVFLGAGSIISAVASLATVGVSVINPSLDIRKYQSFAYSWGAIMGMANVYFAKTTLGKGLGVSAALISLFGLGSMPTEQHNEQAYNSNPPSTPPTPPSNIYSDGPSFPPTPTSTSPLTPTPTPPNIYLDGALFPHNAEFYNNEHVVQYESSASISDLEYIVTAKDGDTVTSIIKRAIEDRALDDPAVASALEQFKVSGGYDQRMENIVQNILFTKLGEGSTITIGNDSLLDIINECKREHILVGDEICIKIPKDDLGVILARALHLEPKDIANIQEGSRVYQEALTHGEEHLRIPRCDSTILSEVNGVYTQTKVEGTQDQIAKNTQWVYVDDQPHSQEEKHVPYRIEGPKGIAHTAWRMELITLPYTGTDPEILAQTKKSIAGFETIVPPPPIISTDEQYIINENISESQFKEGLSDDNTTNNVSAQRSESTYTPLSAASLGTNALPNTTIEDYLHETPVQLSHTQIVEALAPTQSSVLSNFFSALTFGIFDSKSSSIDVLSNNNFNYLPEDKSSGYQILYDDTPPHKNITVTNIPISLQNIYSDSSYTKLLDTPAVEFINTPATTDSEKILLGNIARESREALGYYKPAVNEIGYVNIGPLGSPRSGETVKEYLTFLTTHNIVVRNTL
ncbi:MAG: hypothetical protein QM526_01420 [Alphaproteobacteria bacterium]|nr:hypothetical protein [Alphaproteobacteria bacterium]